MSSDDEEEERYEPSSSDSGVKWSMTWDMFKMYPEKNLASSAGKIVKKLELCKTKMNYGLIMDFINRISSL